jgi:rhodanese-related sulfurtransferase
MTASGVQQRLQNGSSIIPIDLREKKIAEEAHIPSAVTMPFNELSRLLGQISSPRSAPLVLYTETENSDIKTAFSAFKGAGFNNVSILKGGFANWGRAGFNISRGSLSQSINYTPTPLEGVVDVDEFVRAATAQIADTIILDVRSAEELAQGMIKGALAIPANEIINRLTEIPRDKQIFIHCKAGVRAAMVYSLLVDKGFSVKYLDKMVDVRNDGYFTIQNQEL